MIKYYINYFDNGFVHSIDMVKVFYEVRIPYLKILAEIQKLKFKCSKYYEITDLKPSSKYGYFAIHIHFDNVYIKLGKYKLKDKNVDKKEYKAFDCMQLEVNPNKWHDSDQFKLIMGIVEEYAYQGYIEQVDYAIDIPVHISQVVPMNTRKEKGLYKGTYYYGQRGQNGMVKIYNKGLEAQLDYALTRVETTWKLKDKYTSIDFGVIGLGSGTGKKLSRSTGLMVKMLQELQMLGSSNIDTYLEQMKYETRVQVQEALFGKVQIYKYDMVILNKLIEDMQQLFKCSGRMPDADNDFDYDVRIPVDENGFMVLDDDDDILPVPF